MKPSLTKTSDSSSNKLVCPACGGHERFIEVLESEAHIVNGNRDYIRLIEAVTDHFICFSCGESFTLDSTEQ